jgi:hypothetical protein
MSKSKPTKLTTSINKYAEKNLCNLAFNPTQSKDTIDKPIKNIKKPCVESDLNITNIAIAMYKSMRIRKRILTIELKKYADTITEVIPKKLD